jgi:integrase
LLVEVALQTGARYSELTRLLPADFNADAGTLHIRQSKSGKARHVILSDEGQALFAKLELPLRKSVGKPWGRSDQVRRMADAVKAAGIEEANFHSLRHTWASHAVMNGIPLLVVARNLGHSTTRMVEQHYGHMSESHVSDAIRRGAPKFT